jgi:ElaB/YqjD/DUF883 family membrane-anchored ribosome-binding protein
MSTLEQRSTEQVIATRGALMESTSYGSNFNSTTGLSTSAGEGTVNKVSSSAHAAVDSLANAADEATFKVKPKIDKVAALAHGAVDKAAGAASQTADRITERGESLNAAQKKLVADTCSYVSANPLKSVGFALLAGFLLARIVL